MPIDLTIRDNHGLERDVRITAAPGTQLRHLECALAGDGPGLWSGSRRLTPMATLGASGLRTGAVVQAGIPGHRDLAAGAVLRLHIVGGPDAGQVVALPRGITTVGRSPDAGVRVDDPDISREHAAITVSAAGISVRDLDSTNGTMLESVAVDGAGSPLTRGAQLRLGNSTLVLAAAEEPAAALGPTVDGALVLNRPPRIPVELEGGEIELPASGSGAHRQQVRWAAALLPALGGVGLAVFLHNPQFLAFALLGPITIVAGAAADRFERRRDTRRRRQTHRGRLAAAEHRRVAGLAAEAARRRRARPDPASVGRTAQTPDCRLWERRRGDDDFLSLRTGLGPLPSSLRVRRGASTEPAGILDGVPITAELSAGPLGVIGPRGVALGLGRWLLGQLVTLHSPADVQLALLLSDGNAEAWRWARWLPHLQGRVATDPPGRHELVTELLSLLDRRQGSRTSRHEGPSWSGPWLVVVLDRCGELGGVPGLARLLSDGAAVGITAICLDDEQRRLPGACAVVAVLSGETGAYVQVEDRRTGEVVTGITDRVAMPWADSLARALAPIVDGSMAATTALPDRCRLLDVIGPGSFDPDHILARWQSVGEDRPVAAIGMAASGPFSIDLVRDGPHALIAGTTGAGKSELLQTCIAALALNSSPADMSFVLVDYKGGSAFADCSRLPHVTGVVTDLDAHLTARALHSLQAELQRREALFAAAGATDLDAYRCDPAQQLHPLGRLVLVVDEFAALAVELPDFLAGLVSIAQRGRSLGLHLILATQRPSGVVSPEIRANSTLRIALRVTDPGESLDVIGSDAAAAIEKSRPGRAVVRSGSALTEIQTAHVNSPARTDSAEPIIEALDGWRRVRKPAEANTGPTDLSVLVDALAAAARLGGMAMPARPWLPPLPEQLPASTLPPTASVSLVAVGLVDFAKAQCQPSLLFDLATAGPHLIVGTARTGRTTALRTLARSAANRLPPSRLNMHLIDCGGGALRDIAALPHCFSALTHDDPAGIDRLLTRLAGETARRQAQLADQAPGSAGAVLTGTGDLPHLLLLIDGWENLLAAGDEHDGGRTIDRLQRLLRESASVGLTVVITGDRASLSARLSSVVRSRFVLRMADAADYALAGLPMRSVPPWMGPGRAVRADDGQMVQFAQPPEAAPALDVSADVVNSAAGSTVESTGGPHRSAIRVRTLPVTVTRNDLVAGRPTGHVVLGVGGDACEPITVDLFAGAGHWLLAGPPRSGRSTLLQSILLDVNLDPGCGNNDLDVWVAAGSSSPLARTAITGPRVHLISPGSDTVTIHTTTGGRRLVVVDDCERFLDTPAGDALTAFARTGRPGRDAVVIAGQSDTLMLAYRGVADEVRRSRTGILLQPGPGDGDLFGVRLPRARAAAIPGRGLLITDTVAEQPHLVELAGQQAAIPLQLARP